VKLQITDMRTGERHVIDGEDAHVEARLRLLYPGPTENVADGHLGNVIHAVARVQHVGIVPLEHGVPMPAPVVKSESGAGGGLTVWRVENDKGEGPYRGGLTFAPRLPYPQEELVPGSGRPGSPVDIDDRRPMPHIDFEHAHHEALKSGHLKSGFASPEHAVRWFGREGLDVLQQRGFVLRPVLASKVHQSRSGRQVAFEPSVQKSEPLAKMALVHDDAKKPAMVWRVENDRGIGPYTTGHVNHLPDLMHEGPDPDEDFSHREFASFKTSPVLYGFERPEQAAEWFGQENLDHLAQQGHTLRQVPAAKVWRANSGKQVAFIRHSAPAAQK
jgi:hypothetical protein